MVRPRSAGPAPKEFLPWNLAEAVLNALPGARTRKAGDVAAILARIIKEG